MRMCLTRSLMLLGYEETKRLRMGVNNFCYRLILTKPLDLLAVVPLSLADDLPACYPPGSGHTAVERVLFLTSTPPKNDQMKTIPQIKKEQEDKMSELFKQCGVFFAFSNSQFTENKTPLTEGDKYVSIGGGGYCPKSKAESLYEGFDVNDKWYKAEIKANKARKAHILYELDNHEAYYTGDIQSTIDCLGEDYSREEVLSVFRNRKAEILEE